MKLTVYSFPQEMEGDSDNDDDEDESKMTNGDTSRDLMSYDDDVNDPVNVSFI